MSTPAEILALCRAVALRVWLHQLSPDYAETVARILFMTAAHESGGFKYRRQIGYTKWMLGGAWSLWQIELPSIRDSVRRIDNSRALNTRVLGLCADFQCNSGVLVNAFTDDVRRLALLQYIATPEGDPLACVLARLHYLVRPGRIPADPDGMAAYAKKHYNTDLGKATPGAYLAAFRKHWPEEAVA